jgi:type II secretory pathway pseudopilin PulG
MQSRASEQARRRVRSKTRSRGMTLIEILIALIVMVLGVLGILALFPPALQSGTESMEATNAAILAESVAHGLMGAFTTVEEDKSGGATATTLKLRATLTHDAKSGTTTNRYVFILPPLPVNPLTNLDWFHYPSSSNPSGQGGSPPPGDPGSKMTGGNVDFETDDRYFQLGGDKALMDTVTDVRNVNDPTDPLTQFAFSFDVRKVDNMWYQRRNPGAIDPYRNTPIQPQEYEAMMKLYEVRIHILRVSQEAGSTTPYRRYITTFTKRIAIH